MKVNSCVRKFTHGLSLCLTNWRFRFFFGGGGDFFFISTDSVLLKCDAGSLGWFLTFRRKNTAFFITKFSARNIHCLEPEGLLLYPHDFTQQMSSGLRNPLGLYPVSGHHVLQRLINLSRPLLLMSNRQLLTLENSVVASYCFYSSFLKENTD